VNTRTLHTGGLLALAVTSFAAAPALAQVGWGCGSDVKPGEVAQALLQQASGTYDALPPSGTQFRVVRVKCHIVRTSSHIGGISTTNVMLALNEANVELEASQIYLVLQDEVDYVDDDNFYFNITTQAQVDALRAVRPQANMMNVYFTPNLAIESGALCGISSFTFSTSQGLVMNNQCVGANSVLAHEIGHYFDLFHTHETAFGAECVNESNCATAGDLVCDTPADPGLQLPDGSFRVDTQCNYTGGPLDSCSNSPYSPDTQNTMSYTRISCMGHWSPGQQARASATMSAGRLNHLVASVDDELAIHLDTSASTNGNGTWLGPMNSFSSALAATPTGGILAISRADANEGPLTLSRPMVIYNSGDESAVVRLGAP
jgi:Pregnancy-associated plasma protein-A